MAVSGATQTHGNQYVESDLQREADMMVATLVRELRQRQSWAGKRDIIEAIRAIRLDEKSMELERRHLSGEQNIYGCDGAASREMPYG